MINESEFREMNNINDKSTYLTNCINLAHEAAKLTIIHKNKNHQEPEEILTLIKERLPNNVQQYEIMYYIV